MNDEKRPVSRLSGGLQPIRRSANPSEPDGAAKLSGKDCVRAQYGRERDMSKVTVIPDKAELNRFDPHCRKRVVVYCRVSTDGIQQTSSFELQKNYYLKYVRKRPEWKLMALYSDEGLTATSTEKRVGLQTMLEDARAGKFDIIVVKNLSRLSRNLMDCMNIIYELREQEHKVGILFETENMFTLDKNVDFTLQVLSLVAQEESHKKSEAMLASYQQRFQQGMYMKPDLLGFDRVGVNEIAVNEEEAKTVQLIYMMYLAGTRPGMIAEVLTMLGRKTHTRKLRDGRIREGVARWSAGTVLAVLRNERHCGDVLAQKTYTPNFLTHKSKKNDNALPQYYAVDQHPAIVAQDDFLLTQRILRANRGGWAGGLPRMEGYRSGVLGGFVSTVPGWFGFGAEDYNRAALRACGVREEELQELQARIEAQQNQKMETAAPVAGFEHRVSIDSDNYDLFPDGDDAQEAPPEEKPRESFARLTHTVREDMKREIRKEAYGRYDLTGCEVARPQYFSTREKVCFTMDSRGIRFGKYCLDKFSAAGRETEYVRMEYNPVRALLIVRPAREPSERTIRWMSERKGVRTMRRCGCKGIAGAIYANMEWNEEYRCRILGEFVSRGGEARLVFHLDEPVLLVPAKPGVIRDLDTDGMDAAKARKIVRSGSLPEQSFIPDLSDFELSDGPMASGVRKLSRSRAIYYDDLTESVHGKLLLKDLGDRKYDPECIRWLIEKGTKPIEGWGYLKGMTVMGKKGFRIYPESWADSFGRDFYHPGRLPVFADARDGDGALIGETIPYGWTVGLDLPTRETVEKAIAFLKSESA
jgi:DNA invertase Pin-like site-specific DNA recombinase